MPTVQIVMLSVIFTSGILCVGEEMKVICASRTETPPVLDGILDDPCWQKAEVRSDFTSPGAGQSLIRRTTMRALYDQNNIYFGFEVFWDDAELLKKGVSDKEMIDELLKADSYINNDISSALEEWINAHSQEQKEKPYLVLADGKQLTLNDIQKEIRLQTPIGMHFSKNLLKLTIDLISRNKEQLND